MKFLNYARRKQVGAGSVIINHHTVPFLVLPKGFRGGPFGFVGYMEGLLFISEEAPVRFRRYIFWHEVTCYSRKGKKGHCLRTLRQEVRRVPRRLRPAYVRFRLKSFEALVEFLKQYRPRPPLYKEILASRDYLRTVAA